MRCAVLGFISGAAWLHTQPALPANPALALAAVLLAAALAFWRLSRTGRWGGPVLALLLGLAAGYYWAALVAGRTLAVGLAQADEGRDFEITGTIDSLPHSFDGGVRFNFAVESGGPVPPRIALSWFAAHGKSAKALPEVRPGERWQLKVRLQRPHGNANPYGFDYELWLLEQGVRATGYVRAEGRNQRLQQFVATPRNLVEAQRFALRDRIAGALAERPYAAVIAALVMGDQRGISQQDWKVFNRTGIAHLVSISGLHITMIAGLVAWLASWLWRHSFFFAQWQLPLRLPAPRVAALAGVLAGAAYVALAGFGVPAQRTLAMLCVVAAALWLDRLTAISHVLALAALAVVLLDPWAVMWPGFWLSFAAVGVILYATVGRPYSETAPGAGWRARAAAGLVLAARTQYAVTIGLVPLTMLLFAQVSLASPFANAVAIPVISLLVTPLALLGSILPSPLAEAVLQLAHALLALLLDALRWLSDQPYATWAAPKPSWWQFVLAMAGMAWMLAPRGWPLRWLGLACWVPLLAAQPDRPPAGTLRLTVFDVGQGMAVLVETPRHSLLYDTGPRYTPQANGGNRVILPYLRARGIHALDGLVVSHGDSDHAGGALEVLDNVAAGWVLSSLPAGHPVAMRGPRHRRCVSGQSWQWDGMRFDVLHPQADSYGDPALKSNARSCTVRIAAPGGAVLLAGDIEAREEAGLVHRLGGGLRADVLLVPHHGSGTSSTTAFLAAVQPRHALFQLGYRNRYRHPKQEVLDRYASLGVAMARTDRSGAITVELSREIVVREYRKRRPRYWHGR